MKRIEIPSRAAKWLAAGLVVVTLLGLLGTFALAQTEIPAPGSVAFIQTSGPNTPLNIGDWYTNAGQGNHPHNFKIFVPCTLTQGQVLTLELFDPELFFTGTGAIDEIRGSSDNATFTLLAPDNTPIVTTTYPPSATTNNTWNLFTTFDVGTYGCGIYTLLASTSDDDDNAWRLRISHPDTINGSGDEPTLASFETSFQHAGPSDQLTCQDFFFFVPQVPSIRLNNFDLDYPDYPPPATVTYFPPGGGSLAGTASGGTVWNNGTASTRVGDVIANPQQGWWRARACVGPDNQYIFEPEGLVYVLEQPDTPAVAVSKDDGLTTVSPGQTITYTITYANQGSGAALNATLTEILPAETTFVACSGGLSCGLAGPGVVTYSLGTLPSPGSGLPGASGQVTLTVQVSPDAPASTTLTNTARVEFDDVMFNHYPSVEATDVDVVVAAVDLQISKTDGGVTTAPGGVVVYTLTYANVGAADATGVVITETVPLHTSFNATASAPTTWDCADGSGPDTTCRAVIGGVLHNNGGSVTFAVTVDDSLPGDVTQIANVAMIGDDGASGPDPTPGNNISGDSTPVSFPAPEPTQPPTSEKKKHKAESEAAPTSTPPPAPLPTLPAPTPTPPVLFLPETGEGGPPVEPSWWPLVLLMPGLLVAWVIYRRRT